MEVCVALFDVDKTLTVRDCVVPFLRRVAGTPRLLVGVAQNIFPIARSLVGQDRNALKALFAKIVSPVNLSNQ